MIQALLEALRDEVARIAPAFPIPLNPGATPAQIDAAEMATGCDFPPELRQLYALHDGQPDGPGLFLDWPFLSLEQLVAEWQSWRDLEAKYHRRFSVIATSIPRGYIREVYASPRWLPIAKDYGGNHYAIDLDPDTRGQRGQVIVFGRDYDHKQVLALSLAELFQALIRKLKQDDDAFDEDEPLCLEMPSLGSRDRPADPVDWTAQLPAPWQAVLMREFPDGMPQAEEIVTLWLSDSPIQDLAPLALFPELRELIASLTRLNTVAGIGGCAYLKKLVLAKNPLMDLSELAACTALQDISLSNTPVTDLSPLLGLRALRRLSLEGTGIRTITGLECLSELLDLDLSRTAVADLSPLRALTQLSELNISHTAVSDLSVLPDLPLLSAVDLAGLQLEDYTPLAACRQMESISCSFEQFDRLRQILPYRPNIAISGEMTDAQTQVWMSYLDAG